MGIPPATMPIIGFRKTMKAIRTAIRIGTGCGKNGTKVKISIMLTKVKPKVNQRMEAGSVGLAPNSKLLFLNQPETPDLGLTPTVGLTSAAGLLCGLFSLKRDFIRDSNFGFGLSFDGSKYIV